jgi:hypothetical protein
MKNAHGSEALSASLSSLLSFTVRRDQREPICWFEAKQLLFLLSREQVRLFYQMLHEVRDLVTRPESPFQEEKTSSDYDEDTLHAKIRFVPHSAHSPFPAYVTLPAPGFELSSDELQVLLIEVMFLVQDMEMDEAEWCFASHSSGGSCHLVKKEARSRRGPVLCGCLPPPPSEISHVNGWMVQPVIGPVEEKNLCPTCLRLWKTELSRIPELIEQRSSI